MNNHEEGLISQYVEKIQSLGVRAESGEAVDSAVVLAIKSACEHFRIVTTSDPAANLATFKGRLKSSAELTHNSQPTYKRTLLFAVENCPNAL